MRTHGIGILGVWWSAVAGCGGELPSVPEASGSRLTFEPAAVADRVPPVVRLHVAGSGADPATLRLFRDSLSDYHVGRIRAGELPNTLLEREVPALAWWGPEGAHLSAFAPLENGKYSLASPELGAVGVFTVQSDPATPLYERIWPPVGESGAWAAYCGEPAPLVAMEVALAPSGRAAALLPGLTASGLLAERCLRLEVEGTEPGIYLPPPSSPPVLLDPEPLWVVAAGGEPASCPPGALALGSGCAEILDDRLLLSAAVSLLWLFDQPAPALVISEAFVPQAVSGLAPSSTVRVEGETVDVFGRRAAFAVSVTTHEAAARLVLNEVLANPAGPEPALEWVELVNAGSAPANLAGHTLADSGGSVPLPDVSLLPGQFALLAKAGYAPDPALDVPPAAGAVLVAVPALAKNGLSNGGEALLLSDPSGAVISRFPALAAPDPGVSLARRSPDALDLESSFAPHAPPGASPGAPNSIAGP